MARNTLGDPSVSWALQGYGGNPYVNTYMPPNAQPNGYIAPTAEDMSGASQGGAGAGAGMGEGAFDSDNYFDFLNKLWKTEGQMSQEALERDYQLRLQYNPLYMQQEYELQSQYAPKYAEMMKNINESLYPQTSGLQENLAGQASRGMGEEVPDWMQKEYLSNLNASLGTNAGSPIGADYTSRGLLSQQKQYNDYYRDLALSVSGRMPLTTGQGVSTPNLNTSMGLTQGFSPNQYLGTQAQNYQTYSTAQSNYYNTLANLYRTDVEAQIERDRARRDERSRNIGGALGGLSNLFSSF